MAATCPQCATSLDQDFGVVSCPNCHAVLAIDLDGHIEVQQASAVDEYVSQPDATTVGQVETVINQENEGAGDFEPFRETTLAAQPTPDEIVIEEYDSLQVAESEDASATPVQEPLMPTPPVAAEIEDETPFVPEPPRPLINTSSGVISYHLTIEGIDTKSLRVSVKEALSDPKFPWTARDVIRQTNMGVLKLGPMNPVAASLLVRKLKDLPLTLSWRQVVYE